MWWWCLLLVTWFMEHYYYRSYLGDCWWPGACLAPWHLQLPCCRKLKRKGRQSDSPGIHWRRWRQASTSPVNNSAVTLMTFSVSVVGWLLHIRMTLCNEYVDQQDMFCFNHASAFYTSNNIVKMLINNKFKAQTLTGNPNGNYRCQFLASRALNVSCSFSQSVRSIESRCVVNGTAFELYDAIMRKEWEVAYPYCLYQV